MQQVIKKTLSLLLCDYLCFKYITDQWPKSKASRLQVKCTHFENYCIVMIITFSCFVFLRYIFIGMLNKITSKSTGGRNNNVCLLVFFKFFLFSKTMMKVISNNNMIVEHRVCKNHNVVSDNLFLRFEFNFLQLK